MPNRTLLAATVVLLAASAAAAQDVLVLTTDDMRPALADWTAHRTSQGLAVAVRSPGEDAAATVRAVAASSEGRLTHVLIVGDVDRVPCAYRKAVAIARWEEDERIATDAPLADTDGDDVPDLAIGRVSASTPEEARAVLARSIAYETTPVSGDWPRRLGLVAGVGGFGVQEDMALEMLTNMVLSRDVPDAVAAHVTYAKETSPFCPAPSRLQDVMLDTIGSGALAVAYVGHGSARHVDRMEWGGRRWPILEAEGVPAISCSAGPPLLIFVACSTGKLDAEQPCLAELVLRDPEGPAAVIASTRVSTPYGNGLLSVELLHALYAGEDGTAGGVLLAAKRALVAESSEAPSRRAVEAMAGSFYEPDADVRARDRLEHVLLYQLLGDPLLRLRRPAAARVLPPPELCTGEDARLTVRSDVAGELRVELFPRLQSRPRHPGRDEEQMSLDHAASNAAPVATATAKAVAGEAVVVTLRVPADLDEGRYVLRAWVNGGAQTAAGGCSVRVESPR